MILWSSLLLLVAAAVVDLRRREIPDGIPVALLCWAVGTKVFGAAAPGWASMALGFGAGAVLGLLAFWLGGFGGGDAKLLAALGALLGAGDFVVVLFYVALAGGVLGVVAARRGRRDLAYAPAMALGFLVFLITRGVR
jgi:Flp pilus assembly protein protease CpaA